jgi:hypothetical protein
MGLEWILGRLTGGVEWIQLAQDTDQRQALVNMVMNLQVSWSLLILQVLPVTQSAFVWTFTSVHTDVLFEMT